MKGFITFEGRNRIMKMHIEYDDFGEYLEACVNGELYVHEESTGGPAAEMLPCGERGTFLVFFW